MSERDPRAPSALLEAQSADAPVHWRPPVEPPPPREPAAGVFRMRRARARSRVARGVFATQLALLGLVAYGLFFNFSVVRGNSMAPRIHDGDRILVDHLSFVIGGIERGDIVVLHYPLDPSLDYIKRVIGLPGDVVHIENGRVSVNGTMIDEPYVDEHDASTRMTMQVAPDQYFVLGDNRPHSSDSREFGLVPRQNLVGRCDLRVWPPERAGWIDG